MLNIIVGALFLILGLIGMFSKWMLFKEVFYIFIMIGLIAFGIIAFLAGIKKLKKRNA